MAQRSTFSIREYRSQDYSAVVNLMSSLQSHFASVDSFGEMRTFSSIEEAKTYFDQGLKDVKEMNGSTFVALADNQVVGFIQGITTTHEGEVMHVLGHKKSKEGWIGLLFVDSKYRGQGIGKKLLDEIRTDFVHKQCTTMRLLVMSDNHETVAVYKKYGFQPKDIEMVLSLE